jgi:hypothetical protein
MAKESTLGFTFGRALECKIGLDSAFDSAFDSGLDSGGSTPRSTPRSDAHFLRVSYLDMPKFGENLK